jgi:hypothetical protein
MAIQELPVRFRAAQQLFRKGQYRRWLAFAQNGRRGPLRKAKRASKTRQGQPEKTYAVTAGPRA